MLIFLEGKTIKKPLYFHWYRILNINEILERGAGKTPSRELACGMKDRFTLIYSSCLIFFKGLHAFVTLKVWCLFYLRKKIRASVAIERREYNWNTDFQRYIT
jgi:hypothetical protein